MSASSGNHALFCGGRGGGGGVRFNFETPASSSNDNATPRSPHMENFQCIVVNKFYLGNMPHQDNYFSLF